MANTSEAITWILAQSETIDLEVHELTWIQEILPNWSDIVCSLTVDGRKIYGWGAAQSSDTALVKAFAEALERHALYGLDVKTSNGMAAHLVRANARQGAIAEVIERDQFLCHFLTQTPFSPISETKHALWSWSKRLKDWSTRYQLQVGLFHLGKTGVVCAIDGRHTQTPFGYIIGAANKDELESSALSAFIEAARRAARNIEQPELMHPLAVTDFLSLERPDFHDHGRLALDLSYAEQISVLFSHPKYDGSPCDGENKEIDQHLVSVQDVSSPMSTQENNILHDCPFVFAHASSLVTQSIYLGRNAEEAINLKRLSHFLGRPVQFIELNPLPHPFD